MSAEVLHAVVRWAVVRGRLDVVQRVAGTSKGLGCFCDEQVRFCLLGKRPATSYDVFNTYPVEVGRLIGVGGFCDVYEVQGIRSLVVKVVRRTKDLVGHPYCDCLNVSPADREKHNELFWVSCLWQLREVPAIARWNVTNPQGSCCRCYFRWTSSYVAQQLSLTQRMHNLQLEFAVLRAMPLDGIFARPLGLTSIGDGRSAYIMEWIRGPTLRQAITFSFGLMKNEETV